MLITCVNDIIGADHLTSLFNNLGLSVSYDNGGSTDDFIHTANDLSAPFGSKYADN